MNLILVLRYCNSELCIFTVVTVGNYRIHDMYTYNFFLSVCMKNFKDIVEFTSVLKTDILNGFQT